MMAIKQFMKHLIIFVIILALICIPCFSASALTFDGTAGSGGGGGTTTATGGYAIADLWADLGSDDPIPVMGLRFSLYNTSTGQTKGNTIDVYRSTFTNVANYMAYQKPTNKYNKKQLADSWNWTTNKSTISISTSTSQNNCLLDSNLSLTLPTYTSGVEMAIVGNKTTLDKILTQINGSSTTYNDLVYGDRILIEPIYPLTIGGTRYVMTVAEMAFYGCVEFGVDKGNSTSANSGSWGFIAKFTNQIFPNSLYLDTGSTCGVFPYVSELSKPATFKTILSNGYGVAVAYNETNDKIYTNPISHWATGFTNGEGTNAIKDAYQLGSTSFTAGYGTQFTLGTNRAVTIPNGFQLASTFGTSAITGSYQWYRMGTPFTQKNATMSFGYYYNPITYNITYDLAGGTNHASNPTSYNVLYGKTFYEPTKKGYTFDGWYAETAAQTISMTAPTNTNWRHTRFLANVEPGTTYTVSIGSAKLTAGSANKFTVRIHDFTAGKDLATVKTSFGDNVSVSLKCPDDAVASNDIQIIVYAGEDGSTGGNSVTYTNLVVGYETTGINEGCNATFSSANDLYNQLATRATGDIKLTAQWSPIHYTLTVDPNGGTWTYNGVEYTEPVTLDVYYEQLVSGFHNPSRPGFTFTEWEVSNDTCSVDTPYYQHGIGDCTVTARYLSDNASDEPVFVSYIRKIKLQYLDTLNLFSKWRLEPLYTKLKTALENDMSDDESCEQVWYFPAESDPENGYAGYDELHEWALSKNKSRDTNREFLEKFIGNRTWKKP